MILWQWIFNLLSKHQKITKSIINTNNTITLCRTYQTLMTLLTTTATFHTLLLIHYTNILIVKSVSFVITNSFKDSIHFQTLKLTNLRLTNISSHHHHHIHTHILMTGEVVHWFPLYIGLLIVSGDEGVPSKPKTVDLTESARNNYCRLITFLLL